MNKKALRTWLLWFVLPVCLISVGWELGTVAFAQQPAPSTPYSMPAVIGQFNTALPTFTNGQVGFPQLDSSGRLLVGSVASTNQGTANTGPNSWPENLQQGATILNAAPTASAANSAATVTLAGAVGTRVCIRTIAIKATGAAATFTLTVSDGAAVVLDLGTQTAALNGAADLFQGQPLLCGSTGNSVTVNVGAGGVSAITTTSVISDRM